MVEKQRFRIISVFILIILLIVITMTITQDDNEDTKNETIEQSEMNDETGQASSEEEDDSTEENTNQEDKDATFEKPSIASVESQSDALFEVTFKHQDETYQQLFKRISPNEIPLKLLVAENQSVTDENITVKDQDILRLEIGESLLIDYFDPEATEEDVETVVTEAVEAFGLSRDDLEKQSKETLPKMNSAFSGEDFLEVGYEVSKQSNYRGHIYYGKLHGRYVLIRGIYPLEELKQVVELDVLLEQLSQNLPTMVYGRKEVKDDATGRFDHVTMAVHGGDLEVIELDYQLFTEPLLGFSTYIPEGMEVTETEQENLKHYTFNDPKFQDQSIELGIFTGHQSRKEATAYINDRFQSQSDMGDTEPYEVKTQNESGETIKVIDTFTNLAEPDVDKSTIELYQYGDQLFYLSATAEIAEPLYTDLGMQLNQMMTFFKFIET
ncbi:MAG: hypothetical protein ACQER2_06435 [Bacillota bacterium]